MGARGRAADEAFAPLTRARGPAEGAGSRRLSPAKPSPPAGAASPAPSVPPAPEPAPGHGPEPAAAELLTARDLARHHRERRPDRVPATAGWAEDTGTAPPPGGRLPALARRHGGLLVATAVLAISLLAVAVTGSPLAGLFAMCSATAEGVMAHRAAFHLARSMGPPPRSGDDARRTVPERQRAGGAQLGQPAVATLRRRPAHPLPPPHTGYVPELHRPVSRPGAELH